MIKRLICLIVILAVCLSFAACSSQGGCIGAKSSDDVESQATSEDSSEGDDSEQDSSSSASGTQGNDSSSQEDDSASQSDDSSSQNDDDDNSGSDSDSDTDSDTDGATSGTQTGAGSAQGGFAITKQPVSTSVAVGAPLTLSVSASGSGTLTYKWYTSLTNSYNGIELVGHTYSSVSINTANPFTQYYYCVITQVSTGATLTTNIATASAVGSAPTPAPTPVSYNLWIGGVQVTSTNATDVLRDGTVSYNSATNTLNLNGANILYDGTNDKKSPIHSGLNNLTINLNGESTLQSTGGVDEMSDGTSMALHGIYSTDAISINGTGTLNTTGGNHDTQTAGSGIYAGSGLTIYSGTINAKGGESGVGFKSTGGEGIYTHTGSSVTIWGGTITAIGGLGESRGGMGIYLGGNLYIYGNPTITAQGMGRADIGYNGEGIYTRYDITLGNADNPFNGSLTAICGEFGGLTKAYALYKDVTSYFFGADMKYYTSTDGTIWEDKGDATSLPNNHYGNFGLRFAPPTP